MAVGNLGGIAEIIQNDTAGLHRQNAGNSHPLFLATAQKMGAMLGKCRHADSGQSITDALTDFFRRDTQIFRSESDIFFYDGCDDLIIGILENHAHILADFP